MATQVKGLDGLLDNLEEMEIVTLEAAKESLNVAAEVLKKTAHPLIPKKTGALRRSVRIFKAISTVKFGLRALVTWGGVKAPYAAWVHEMPSSFDYTTPGTGPKYATRAVSLLYSVLPKNIADNIGMRLKSAFPPTSRKGATTITVKLNG